jgi:CDP-diacylglycerol--glycerol-3-phosphate 3-phosphatidyltransferase
MDKATSAASDQIWNVPNRISAARLVLSCGVFVVLSWNWFWAGFILFVVAASTDWVDGWYARKFNLVSKLGRVLDPFCDKILICGTFILLAVAMRDYPWYLRIAGWMAVVVVGRELLVTVLRSMVEGSGGDFSAKFAGKLKMWLQCIAAGAALVALGMSGTATAEFVPAWVQVVLAGSVWAAVVLTVWSAVGYVQAAAAYFRDDLRPKA